MSIDQDEGISHVSGHSHGGMESYDVFHDPPQRSPRESLEVQPILVDRQANS